MGKALFGANVDPRSLQLLDEVRSLRERVAELEQALEAAQEAADSDAATATREHATT
jgi:cell division septum initiation protein DivIVA